MQNTSKFYSRFLLIVFLFVSFSFEVVAETQISTANVSATVLGAKPIVNLITPVTGTNTGAVALTKIVGRNFGSTGSDIVGVSLDDLSSTVLSGSVVLTNDCDSNGDNCGGGGSYQLITGLSVPAGVNPGVYNVLVTTALGTNLFSDVKYTVTAPAPTATPSITSIKPSYIAAIGGLADVVPVSFTISDSDSNAVHFDTDSNISIGAVTTDTYSPATRETTAASGTGGEIVSFSFNSNSAPEEYGTLDIRVGDGGTPTTGNTSFKVVNIFIEPNW